MGKKLNCTGEVKRVNCKGGVNWLNDKGGLKLATTGSLHLCACKLLSLFVCELPLS